MLRTDTPYVDGKGQFTQAGVRAIQTLIDEQAAAIAVLQAADATEAANAPGSAPRYACRAWVNFNGTGVVAIRASANVTSITDGGVGVYTVNLTTAMPDANYSVAALANNGGYASITSLTASAVNVSTRDATGTLTDYGTITVAIFR